MPSTKERTSEAINNEVDLRYGHSDTEEIGVPGVGDRISVHWPI